MKPRKKQFEELYKRDTVWLENDFKKSFDEEGAEGKKEKKRELALLMRLLECTLRKIDI
ncbi:hypothetical protein [Paenibacillus sp. 1-18]|uniref:hypothetical protein n=1 Tax=Paenibacillus sp. 1-18 TaxID=1333846 RepID=UPI0018CBF7F3|nr:hypothetical protein [Paenibacillus sp. 1-18]